MRPSGIIAGQAMIPLSLLWTFFSDRSMAVNAIRLLYYSQSLLLLVFTIQLPNRTLVLASVNCILTDIRLFPTLSKLSFLSLVSTIILPHIQLRPHHPALNALIQNRSFSPALPLRILFRKGNAGDCPNTKPCISLTEKSSSVYRAYFSFPIWLFGRHHSG